MKSMFGAAVAAFVFFAGAAGAQEKVSPEQQFLASLQFQEGRVVLPEAHATLQLNDRFRFLAKADARRVLEDFWGNPEDDTVIGLLVPTEDGLASEHSWAVMLTWSDDGHISDEDAAEIDYEELLAEMQAAQNEANPELEKAGYPTAQIIGWAQAPHYDATGKRLHWAKHLQFSGSEGGTLNYDIRVLGREGFLSMNAISSIDDLARVNRGMEDVLQMATFDEGQRYADYNEDTDRVAAYGLAALVGGGLAAKSGLLAKLGLLLAKGGKLLIFAAVGLFAVLKNKFSKKNSTVQ